MNYSFDLIYEPWIPCITLEGRREERGIRTILQEAHRLREIAAESPPATVAIHRLLLALLHRVYDGPRDRKEWGRIWEAGAWPAAPLERYLEQWRERFDLFHPERPFYQAADARVKPKSVAALLHEVASGNNGTLFSHQMDDEDHLLTPAQAARALVTNMGFGLAGLSGLPEKFTAAPCAGGVIFLVEGESLFASLMLNWVAWRDDEPLPRLGEDIPAWERADATRPERSQPTGWLDYLTWPNRRILLQPERIGERVFVRSLTTAPGLRFSTEVRDPMKHHTATEKYGLRPLRLSEERALWRDSAAILESASSAGEAPVSVRWVSQLVNEEYLDSRSRGRIRGFGMASDQAKVEFYRSERVALPLTYVGEEAKPLRDALSAAIQAAETGAKRLHSAARDLASWMVKPDYNPKDRKSWPHAEDVTPLLARWDMDRRYWSQIETPFQWLLERLPGAKEEALREWAETVRATATSAMEEVGASLGNSPRELKAWVLARHQLGAGLNADFPRVEEAAAEQATAEQAAT